MNKSSNYSLCFASSNANKIEEIRKMIPTKFSLLGLNDIELYEEIPETGLTFQQNAFQKADYVFEKRNINCFADDSGLCVYALNNDPGIFSARYAGQQRNSLDNINLLLSNLSDIKDRKAFFITVIALRMGNETFYFEGKLEGEITQFPIGENGFGYDSIFKPNGLNHTLAQMSTEEKNQISHRYLATKKLILFLKSR